MRCSLRRRLLVVLSAGVVIAWAATAFFSYLDTRHLIDEMLDSQLVQSAELVPTLLPSGALEKTPLAGGTGSVVAYRAWTDAGGVGVRSTNMPKFPQAPWKAGFSNRTADGEEWRVYAVRTDSGLFVEVAQREAFRATFAESVATHILHPVWFAVPLLGFLIWLSVPCRLAPLKAIADNVEKRSAGDLLPLDRQETPAEIWPLITALNRLFARIGVLLDKERQFTADAAHELRTPLAAIKTHAQVARRSREAGEREGAIDSVLEGADRAIRLVEQLLVLARLDQQGISMNHERIDLMEIMIEGVKDAAPMAAEKRIDCGLGEGGEAFVVGTPDLLAILVRNLLDNAIRYTAEGGMVGAWVARVDGRPVLSVSDTGPGIPAERRQRAFDRFYRIEGSGQQGCGLGLSIVSRIAEIHGASVGLDSGPGGEGLAVTVSFPPVGEFATFTET